MTKKRRRSSEDLEQPSKKTNLTTGSQKIIKVSTVPTTGDWGPVVASLPGLSMSNSISLKPYKRARSTASSHSNGIDSPSSRTSEIFLHSSSHPKVDYTAREPQDGSTDGLVRHYVGVYSPQTGIVEVMEVPMVMVRGILRPAAETPGQETPKQTNQNLRNDLGRTFGTKKAQKAIASLTYNAISTRRVGQSGITTEEQTPSTADPATAATLENIAAYTDNMATSEELQAASDVAKPRPKSNPKAEKPQDVYPLDMLVDTEEMKVLPVREWQEAASTKNDITTKSLFVSRRVQKIASSGDMKKLKILRYLLLLLDFYSALRGARRDKKSVPRREELRKVLGVQDFLIASIMRKYGAGSPLDRWHIDNLITHIAALALTVDGYEVDTYELKQDLRLDTKDMSKYFQEIGCRIATLSDGDRRKQGLSKAEASEHRLARLRLPLEFPKTRAPRARH